MILAAAFCGAALCGGGALAAPAKGIPEATRAAVLKGLIECRKETVDAARLACFDKTSATLDEAEKKGELVVLDREAVRTARREAFGLDLSAITLFKRAPANPQDNVDKVALVIDHGGRGPDGKWRFFTEEGATWIQTDDEELRTPPHKGSELAVKKAAIGSFFCKVDGQRSLRCVRQR